MSLDNVDQEALQQLFNEYDTDKSGAISVSQLESMLVKLGVAPMEDPLKRQVASEAGIAEHRTIENAVAAGENASTV